MDFEVKGFCAENLEEKIHKRYLQGIPFLPHGPKSKPPDHFGVDSFGVGLRTCCQPVPCLDGVLCPKEGQWSHHILRAGCSLHPLARDTVVSLKTADTSPSQAMSTHPCQGDWG